MVFSKDERMKDLVNLIENPEESAYVGTDEFDEVELNDTELENHEEFYNDEEVETEAT